MERGSPSSAPPGRSGSWKASQRCWSLLRVADPRSWRAAPSRRSTRSDVPKRAEQGLGAPGPSDPTDELTFVVFPDNQSDMTGKVRLRARRSPRAPRRGPLGKGGFSLVELLIVLALLLFMVVLFHGFGSRSRQEKDKAGCRKNLQRIFVALEIFANEHDGSFPATAGARTSEEPLSLLVPKYTVATESFICPGGRDSALPDGESFSRRKISYAYYMGLHASDTGAPLISDRQINTEFRKSGDPLFSANGDSPGNNHHQYGGNVLFVGGDIRTSRPVAEFSLSPTQAIVLLNPKP